MKRSDMRVAIVRMEGTNCEQELYDSFSMLGTKPEFLHLNDFKNLENYHCLAIPGGFSAGDYVRAGGIFASLLRAKAFDEIKDFVKSGFPVLGICNGFQVLTELGFLPGSPHKYRISLSPNESGKFECRPTFVRYENSGKCVLTSRIKKGEVRLLPSAHAEGKIILENSRILLESLEKNDQIVFRWVDPDGNPADYPWNPNGSYQNLAGICNYEGNVLGLMPHPERVFFGWQHPDWTRAGNVKEAFSSDGDGKAIFESMVSYLEKKF
jgi:phosphoribosylformylglycinamidine synthase